MKDTWKLYCRCGCGGMVTSLELIDTIIALDKYYNGGVVIHSGFRCLTYNRSIGSKDTSQHVKGTAVDMHVQGIVHAELHGYILSLFPDKYGIGLYSWGVHFDVRPSKARW